LSNGISLYTDCAVNGISANTITNCLNSGIKASTRCSLGDISSNMITGVTKEAGVVVYNSSSSGLITQNTISTGNCYGIKASKNSAISAISANALSDSKKNAIYVFSDSTVVGGITSNKITNVKTPINILSTSNDLLIDSNKITGAYSNVVVIDTKTNKSTVAIMNNSISGNKTSSGIWVKSGRFAAQGNTIQNVGKGIATQTSVSGSIFENIFKSTVKTKMSLNGKTSYSFGYKKMAAKKLESRARGKCTISWNKYKYANQYEIQYSTRSDFSKNVKTIKAGKVRDNVTLSGLKSKKTYYVRIRAINVLNGVKVYNSYGTIKKIKM
ncbi:MAG: fibronectin type III domain-containing protein, partial [Agathobacter sp.]|nr:fibronectin type III domain-containing protein [Agathobacter sp.]